jgi:hypothetical protein
MIIQNARQVTISDESGERIGVTGEFLIEGAQLEMLRTTDLSSATKPSAEDSRELTRPFAQTVQALVLP